MRAGVFEPREVHRQGRAEEPEAVPPMRRPQNRARVVGPKAQKEMTATALKKVTAAAPEDLAERLWRTVDTWERKRSGVPRCETIASERALAELVVEIRARRGGV
jgi:hypothetical protein